MRFLITLLSIVYSMLICSYGAMLHKPIIGISCSNSESSSSVSKSYCNAVTQSGGIAVMIPVTTDSTTLRDVLSCLDGIIMTGGGDIHPSYFGEQMVDECGTPDATRDKYDILLIKMAAQQCIPMLGICRGEQLINVAFGGTLYQDLPSQFPSDTLLQHRNVNHRVITDPTSWIANITGADSFESNTYHHQAVKDIAPGFKVTGWSEDRVIEVIENIDGYPIWGLQFHPEKMFGFNPQVAQAIFDFFIKKASTYRHAKELHRKIISIDTHTDSPLDFNGSYTIGLRGKYQVDIPKMQEGYLDAQYLACWVRQGELTSAGRQNAKNRVDELINRIYQQVERNNDECGVARNANEIHSLKAEGKKAFLIGIENGYAIGKNIKLIEEYHNKGVTYITL